MLNSVMGHLKQLFVENHIKLLFFALFVLALILKIFLALKDKLFFHWLLMSYCCKKISISNALAIDNKLSEIELNYLNSI